MVDSLLDGFWIGEQVMEFAVREHEKKILMCNSSHRKWYIQMLACSWLQVFTTLLTTALLCS